MSLRMPLDNMQLRTTHWILRFLSRSFPPLQMMTSIMTTAARDHFKICRRAGRRQQRPGQCVSLHLSDCRVASDVPTSHCIVSVLGLRRLDGPVSERVMCVLL